jgi:hypothetical protein
MRCADRLRRGDPARACASPRSARSDPALLVAGFFVATYLVWLFSFGILRYVVALEMISGVACSQRSAWCRASRRNGCGG